MEEGIGNGDAADVVSAKNQAWIFCFQFLDPFAHLSVSWFVLRNGLFPVTVKNIIRVTADAQHRSKILHNQIYQFRLGKHGISRLACPTDEHSKGGLSFGRTFREKGGDEKSTEDLPFFNLRIVSG